jgi:hypothetical protein
VVSEPIVVAARRPPPKLGSAEAPSRNDEVESTPPLGESIASDALVAAEVPRATRRAARIVDTGSLSKDRARVERERLLARLVASDGRAMISRAATECQRAGVEFPLEQAVQLQLLEHVDEAVARAAMSALAQIFGAEAPMKRPVLEQRLRRLEDSADEEATRSAAAELRRSLRA